VKTFSFGFGGAVAVVRLMVNLYFAKIIFRVCENVPAVSL
jgi:hypothetical protein